MFLNKSGHVLSGNFFGLKLIVTLVLYPVADEWLELPLMDQLMRFLAPRSALGFVTRLLWWLGCIALANAGFAMLASDHESHPLGYYVAHALIVGGPMIMFFLIVTTFQMRLQRRLWNLSRKDGLTDLFNRTTFFERMVEIRARESQGVLLMLDADHFKSINDTYGHQAGDRCLQAIAHTLGRSIRQEDVLGRLGGEEFAIYLKKSGAETARVIGERLTKPISFTTDTEKTLSITMSIGGVVLHPDISIDTLFARADAALYLAKKNGRARFVLWTPALQEETVRKSA